MEYYLNASDENGGCAGARLIAPEAGDFGYLGEQLAFRYKNTAGRVLYLKVAGAVEEQVVALSPTYGWGTVVLEGLKPDGTRKPVESVDIYLMAEKSGTGSENLSGSLYLADFAFTNDPNFGNIYIKAESANVNMGWVEGGNAYCKPGSTVVLSAYAKDGYEFIGWSKDKSVEDGGTIVSTNSTSLMRWVASDLHYVANFAPQ